jgi:uncharacterized protein (DUF302 family)
MENWKERFRNQFVDTYGEKDSKEWRIAYQPIEELEDFISKELDKAREEGFEQGYKEAKFDCEMGKEFSKESFKEVVSSVSSKLKDNK